VEQQRLLYEAGGTEIDLEVGESKITGRLRMLGHVTADEPHLAMAWVVADGPSGRLEAEIDGLGRFSFDGLVSGVHRLEIGLVHEMIESPRSSSDCGRPGLPRRLQRASGPSVTPLSEPGRAATRPSGSWPVSD
jgi:hypothetical protein